MNGPSWFAAAAVPRRVLGAARGAVGKGRGFGGGEGEWAWVALWVVLQWREQLDRGFSYLNGCFFWRGEKY